MIRKTTIASWEQEQVEMMRQHLQELQETRPEIVHALRFLDPLTDDIFGKYNDSTYSFLRPPFCTFQYLVEGEDEQSHALAQKLVDWADTFDLEDELYLDIAVNALLWYFAEVDELSLIRGFEWVLEHRKKE